MMKLLSYHIENYGKIQNQDGDLSQDLTCFCEKNGFGKSTLASFIKAMFYGLPSYTVATKGFNDRQHFYPFGGGKFGGNLSFESNGDTYKIERFFDKKSAKGDECRVYKNGVPFDGFGEEIGKGLFGLDEESFKKTVFITADEIEISSTHSINEKLNRTVEATEEDGFEKALSVLESAKKSLKAARGNNDKISKKKAEIVELNDTIQNLKDMSEGLAETYVERERLIVEIEGVEEALKNANERNLVLQKWETFDSMSKQKETKENEIRLLREKYPLSLPNEAERKELFERLQQNDRLRGSLQTAAFGADKEERLRVLREKFKNGVPKYEDIEENQRKINRILAVETERENLLSAEKTTREQTLEGKFSVNMPSEETLKEKRALVEELKRKETEYKTRSEAILQMAQPQITRKKTNKLAVYLLVFGFALLGAGIGLQFVIQALGIGLIVGGSLSLLVALILRSRISVNATMPTANAQLDTLSLQAEIKILEEKIRAFTVPYGYYGELGAAYDFTTLAEDFAAYQAYLHATKEREKTIERLSEDRASLYRETSDFLEKYDESAENLQSGLNRLAAALNAYAVLQEDRKTSEGREKSAKEALLENETRVLEILKKYGLDGSLATMDGLKRLEVDAKEGNRLKQEVDAFKKELTDYKEKNRLEERPEEEVDAEGLRERSSSLRKRLADCDKKIAEVERSVETLPDAENALAIAEETLKEYKEKYGLIADTIEALKGAEQTLKDKYVAPIKERFFVYAQALEKVLGEKIGMDKDFRIVFERGGESRSEKHLSAGERSLCALCLRLALIDNMYETEKPFIVIDDPFVHLDETHMERTKSLIRELAQGKQIVYFCCHESRNLNRTMKN